MEEIKDYDKYPQRYYNIAGRSVINEKFDQDFDKPSHMQTAYPQQSEQTNQDFKHVTPFIRPCQTPKPTTSHLNNPKKQRTLIKEWQLSLIGHHPKKSP